MGSLFSMFGGSTEKAKVLVVGLDNSGKTTILNRLKPDGTVTDEVTPTVGFTVEQFKVDNLQFEAFDMGGAQRFRTMWESRYADVDCVIFVVDSADKLRLVVAKDEFDGMLENDSIKARPVPVPVLVFANKMDVKDAMDHVEVSEGLGLAELSDRPWHIEASNALSGEGLDEGVKWLGAQVTKQKEEAKGGGGAGAAKGGAGAGAGAGR